jgi:3-isopropylmalate/(R)-2-methylmalate dehydratase small subunit
MTPFTRVEGPVAQLAMDNVDTDQLIPARFMTRSRAEGYGDALLYDLRFDPDGHPRPEAPKIDGATFLVAGENFGCGSSREAAVYALADAGIRAVLANGFADIFRSNAMKNGLLPVSLTPEGLKRAAIARHIIVDLEACEVLLDDGGPPLRFDVPAAARRRMLQGLDEVADTLTRIDRIEAHEAADAMARPWALPALPLEMRET